MSDTKEIKIFLIEAEQAIRVLFEELYGEQVYTLESLEDASFRIPDFGPDLVLLGAKLYLENPQKALEAMNVCADIPCALVGFEEELTQVKESGWDKGMLAKPLAIGSLKETLSKLHSQL